MIIPDRYIEELISEDCPYEDITTEGLGILGRTGCITCRPKAAGVIAGLDIAAAVFEKAGARVERLSSDGCFVPAGEAVLKASGSARSLHSVYKTAQNVMEYASGVANRTRSMCEAARRGSPSAVVAGTRKHYPGGKYIAYAGLFAGGGIVHRHGLSDSILVFDQHRVFFKSEQELVDGVGRLIGSSPERKTCVEVGSIEEGMKFVRMGVDIIQCERFSVKDLAEFAAAAKKENPRLVINAAGGVNPSNVQEYAAAGADVLVSSFMYFGSPFDVKMKFSSGADS